MCASADECAHSHVGFPIPHTLPTAEILSGKNERALGISGLWLLNKIIQKKYPENMKKNVVAVWKLPAK